MNAERERFRLRADRVVEEIHVAGDEPIGVVASGAKGLAVLRIAEKREGDRVELDVRGAPMGEVGQLFAVDPRDVFEEFVEVGVDRIGDALAESEEML